jgi:hydroxymethylbilane synthase
VPLKNSTRSTAPLKIGTRGSDLALAQAGQVAALLEASGRAPEIVVIETSGDRGVVPAADTVGKTLWTKEIEDRLLAGSIQLAVHSLKDLPSDLPPGLSLGTVLAREDPRDALVSKKEPWRVDQLPSGARIGTGSGRRAAALRAMRADLSIEPLKGNVPTRLQRLESGGFDAIVLAAAGLRRLGLQPPGLLLLDPEDVPPALGQGVIAVEVRESDADAEWLASLVDEDTLAAARAERALLRVLDVGCGAPVGGLATVSGATLSLFGVVMSPDGRRRVRRSDAGPAASPEALGEAVGRALLEAAGDELMAELRSARPLHR